MNPRDSGSIRSLLRHPGIALGFAAFAVTASAQVAPATDAATLARYDRNRNGVLDPDEVAAMEAERPKPDAVAVSSATAPAKTDEEVVALSPFEVVSDTKGYYSSNTMSGTRFNSKIEDLGASITVMTKEQMQDFAMLDINDVFLYAANTEGTGTYTDLNIDRNGSYTDNVEMNPQGANRIRGIASANVSMGNFETMGRSPVDPLAIDGIEVSRGPNANVFGLGSPAGTVNQVPASANVSRNRSQVQTRGDSYGGYRTQLDLNRVLMKGVLALRVSSAFQHDAYVRKPSGTDSVRYNAMIRFQPFKYTSVTASVSYYRMNGTRANAAPPRDQLSYWIRSGRPTWDPITEQVHLNGATVGTYTSATGLPDYFLGTFTGSTRSQVFVDQNGIGFWTTPNTNNPTSSPFTPIANGQGTLRLLESSGAAGVSLGHITAQPLFTTTPTIGDKSIYDWSSINTSAVNRIADRTITSNIQLDQFFFNNRRQSLAFQGGFFREDALRYARNILGDANQNGASGQLIVDVNERLLDGTPNPYFLRPFLGTDAPATVRQPYKWDTYRGQLAYKLDLTQEPNLLKWLGLHQVTGYDEYKYRIQRQYRYRDGIADNHVWNPATLRQSYYRYYVGDNVGSNIDYAPSRFKYGTYPFTWGGYAVVNNGIPVPSSGVFNREPALMAEIAQTDNGGGGSNSKTIQKTQGAVIQSHFLNDRVVTTFGLREDKIAVKFGAPNTTAAPLLNADGLTYNYENFNHWSAVDWRANSGKTKTSGVVVKPFRELSYIRRMDESGRLGHIAANLLGGLSLSYNRSDSFTPQTPAQDLFLHPLPNASGVGEDYGFTLNAFDGRFVMRVNHYINKSLNSRSGDANTIAQRVLRHDVSQADPFQLYNRVLDWTTAQHPEWTTDQLNTSVLQQIGFTQPLYDALRNQSPPIAATNDILAKGNEVEINYNPTRYWTVAASLTETRSITTNVSASVQQWIDLRMPIWTTITDPRGPDHVLGTTDDAPVSWWTTNYGGSQTAQQNFQTFVEAPYAVIHQQEGKPKPQVRPYAARVSTNFRFAGVTENRILKNVGVGGALRWEDKSAIGFYGVQSLPAVITALDPNRPVYDKGHYYVDAFLSYRMRLWSNKVGATFQLNVRNIQEGGRLQMTSAFPDGSPAALRIVDPRQFIFTATFDL
jgi:hypothetical protein